MELKPGYKQTEVGLIPEGWEAVKAGDIGHFRGGNGFPTRFQGATTGDFPFYKVSDMNNEGNETFMIDSNNWISEGVRKQLSANAFPADSIVFAKVGAAVFLERKKILTKPSCIDNNLAALVLDKSRTDVRFVHYSLLNIKFGAFVSTTALPSLSGSVLLQIPLALPPLPDQCAIAAVLSDMDVLIGSLDKLIAKKRDIKQAAMQQLLTGQTRLPGFIGTNAGYKQPEVGVIPEDWEVMRFGDCLSANPDYGINAPAVTYSDRLPIYIRITDITEKGCFSPEKLVSVRHTESSNYYLSDGDIVFARTGASVGKSYCYDPQDGQLVFAGFLIRVRPDSSKLLPAFAAAYVTTGTYWNWVRLMSMRSGQPGINGNEYAQLPIPVPPLPEQRAIATVLSDMDAEIAALEARRDKTRALKQGMMQELLTGRTRIV